MTSLDQEQSYSLLLQDSLSAISAPLRILNQTISSEKKVIQDTFNA